TSILGGVHYYVWARLFRSPGWPAPTARVAGIVLTLLCLSIPVGFILRRRAPDSALAHFALVPLFWLGVAFLLLLASLGVDLLRGLLWVGERIADFWRTDAPPSNPGRRALLARALPAAALASTGGLTLLGMRAARGEIGVREVPVRLERLPRALDGLT